MGDESNPPTPPRDLPEDIGRVLNDHSANPQHLQETIIYAQELLNELHEPLLSIEPREGEEIVEISDQGGYTRVIKRPRGQSEAYLYHVREESHPDGSKKLHWALMGRVNAEDL